MGRGPNVLRVVAIATAAFLAGAPAAHGRTVSHGRGQFAVGGSLGAAAAIPASSGYLVGIRGRAPDEVGVAVSNGFSASAGYSVRGSVSAAGIRANLGRFGRIAVEFRPKGTPKVEPPTDGCKGEASETEYGVFVGKIRFRGEGGYVVARASRVPATVHRSGRQVCEFGASPATLSVTDPERQKAQLTASCGGLIFGASGLGPEPGGFAPRGISLVHASSDESRGRVHITRNAFTIGGHPAFIFDEALSSATVNPPPPFHGRATFARDASGRGTLTGSLSVSFPGRRIALTGPRFAVRLGRSERKPPRSTDPACRQH